jgi:ribonuclease BN (tRNA processing enzyme)
LTNDLLSGGGDIVLKFMIGASAFIWGTAGVSATGAPSARPALQAGQSVVSGQSTWVTLGTQGGPIPSMTRSEPANLLLRNGEAHLVDAGDDAVTRMTGAGVKFSQLKSIWISHLHFDHTGGLFAVLGLLSQTRTTTPLTIYGPPGTKAMVAGLIAALVPGSEEGFGIPGEAAFPAGQNISVVELRDGAMIKLPNMQVSAVKNTHFSFPSGSPMDRRFESLSYRFDMPDRSIVYSGDTGPSSALEKLATNADLLVIELVDLEVARDDLAIRAPDLDPKRRSEMLKHLSTHHLTTDQIGAIAAAAKVKAVVITHLGAGAGKTPAETLRYVREVGLRYTGPVTVAADMQRF